MAKALMTGASVDVNEEGNPVHLTVQPGAPEPVPGDAGPDPVHLLVQTSVDLGEPPAPVVDDKESDNPAGLSDTELATKLLS